MKPETLQNEVKAVATAQGKKVEEAIQNGTVAAHQRKADQAGGRNDVGNQWAVQDAAEIGCQSCIEHCTSALLAYTM
ncbi:hypothetical protein AC579_5500 [Pseudocercospora musae]|uniref:Uncharacterized protein n=1 Tax=Pseudocercospora musae TaxID=113226 RepID=A0A139IQB8_9PEZI|nr:hypothetical protein AC579_5500 [Pseudocercospora musae]